MVMESLCAVGGRGRGDSGEPTSVLNGGQSTGTLLKKWKHNHVHELCSVLCTLLVAMLTVCVVCVCSGEKKKRAGKNPNRVGADFHIKLATQKQPDTDDW